MGLSDSIDLVEDVPDIALCTYNTFISRNNRDVVKSRSPVLVIVHSPLTSVVSSFTTVYYPINSLTK